MRLQHAEGQSVRGRHVLLRKESSPYSPERCPAFLKKARCGVHPSQGFKGSLAVNFKILPNKLKLQNCIRRR
ncbi:hypothetical protein EVAR_72396_1 [Eumeta japonica]|uniref:Uncharacterized protein n=1 Tax=Eumeta variegata TaxID=151549 RepID=A0A4C1TL72_EUMVA|nr:hypothetical protein EVAR_72396_1 [Eumeta japonica]